MNADSPFYSRRGWVKQFVLGTATALTGPRWIGNVLADVESTPAGAAVLRLKVADFPTLAEPGGSVQMIFNEILKPFTLNRVTTDRFVTLDSVCTHAGCTVGKFIVANNRMRCPCHGSRYDIEGRVFRDENGVSTEPAQNDLARFVTGYDVENGIISITIPNLALGVKSIDVARQGADESIRLKLVFPVTALSVYEIRHQSEPGAPGTLVGFSLTPDGPADRMAAFPQDDGDFTAYVDSTGPRGFFVVGLKLTPFG